MSVEAEKKNQTFQGKIRTLNSLNTEYWHAKGNLQ